MAFFFMRYYSFKLNISSKLYNFLLFIGVISIVAGYLFAVLFQSMYTFIASGVWNWESGATFYGGFIGGAIIFLLLYFGLGYFFFKDKTHISKFIVCINMCVTVIVVAHAFGRIGCLMEGCCYGITTDSWIGIHFIDDPEGVKRLPTQLFEAIFLFIFFIVLSYLLIKRGNKYIISIYLIGYGIWRFLIEFIRDDVDRGSIGIPGLWPSQLIAIIMVVIGLVLIFIYKYFLISFLDSIKNEK